MVIKTRIKIGNFCKKITKTLFSNNDIIITVYKFHGIVTIQDIHTEDFLKNNIAIRAY